MKVSIWRALAASPGWAHMMSMSSGDFTVDGARAHYELRMPLLSGRIGDRKLATDSLCQKVAISPWRGTASAWPV
jgi:hypothetical protein